MTYLAISGACLFFLMIGWHLGIRGRVNAKYELGFRNGSIHNESYWHSIIAMRAIALLQCLRTEEASRAIQALEYDVDSSIVGLWTHEENASEIQIPKDVQQTEASVDRLIRKYAPDSYEEGAVRAVKGIIAQHRAQHPSVEQGEYRKARIEQFLASHN